MFFLTSPIQNSATRNRSYNLRLNNFAPKTVIYFPFSMNIKSFVYLCAINKTIDQ